MSTDRPPAGPVEHIDLDTLAELEEGLLEPAIEQAVRDHLADCAGCRERLRSIADVRAALATAPVESVPWQVAARVDAGLARARRRTARVGGGVPAPSRGLRWSAPRGGVLAGAAAASIVLLLFSALGLGLLRDGRSTNASSAGGTVATEPRSAGGDGVTASGRDYDAATVRAAVPALVGGRSPGAPPARAAAAPADVARLRHPAALAPCITELAGRGGVQPLAVDLARFGGKPAAVVVLPETGRPASLDVWVVGPGCTLGDPQLLYFTRLSRPPGIASP